MKKLKYRNKETKEVFNAYKCGNCKKVWKAKSMITDNGGKKDECISCVDWEDGYHAKS